MVFGQTFATDLILSGISAAISKTIVAPIERVKLILQVQSVSTQIKEPYKGLVDCLIRLPKEQGVLSYWRGNFVNVCRYFPTQAFNFAFHGLFIESISGTYDRETQFGKYLALNIACGGLAGALSQCLVYPLTVCFTKISLDIGNNSSIQRQYTGLSDCILKTSRASGVQGLYLGFYTYLYGVVLYRGLYFGLFDTAKDSLSEIYVDKPTPFLVSWSVAQTITVFAGFLSYPFDTIGRQIMIQTGSAAERKNGLALTRIALDTGGVPSLFKGFFTNILRCTSGSLVLVLYDELKYQFLIHESIKSQIITTERYHQFWRIRYPSSK